MPDEFFSFDERAFEPAHINRIAAAVALRDGAVEVPTGGGRRRAASRRTRAAARAAMALLTERQRIVLELLAKGHSHYSAAARLGCARPTITIMVRRIRGTLAAKLGARLEELLPRRPAGVDAWK
jgi:DNA-binding CsgD family transcriptional regulator